MELDATTQVDQFIQSYQPSQLILWITLGVILVALIALGSEFWVNMWGMIWSPSLTFQRLLGEAQWVPGIVVVALIGMASAAIVQSYFANPTVVENMLELVDPEVNVQAGTLMEQLDGVFEQIGSEFTIAGNIKYIREFAFQTQSIAMAIPLYFLLLWLIWGLAGQLGSMIAGNKAGHGVSNLWSAVPYAFLIWVPSTWFFMMAVYGNGFAKILLYIFQLFFLVLHVAMMREHGRYTIQKAIVATILTLILVPVFLVVLAILAAFIAVQVATYL